MIRDAQARIILQQHLLVFPITVVPKLSVEYRDIHGMHAVVT
jgi:hypothetical protein